MHLHKVEIKNFRLLAKVELLLETNSTVIVGRNNSGKTSLTELFRRLLVDSNPVFRLEDFSLSSHDDFWKAFQAKEQKKSDDEVRTLLPCIEVKLTVAYGKTEANLGPLGDWIIDVDPNCEHAIVQIRYAPQEGEISAFFADVKVDPAKSPADQRAAFCPAIRDRVPKFYSCSVQAVDPGDAANTKALDWASFRAVIGSGFINAQRGLDDVTNKDRDVLGKVLEALFKNAKAESADERDRDIAKQLENAVQGIQLTIDSGFNLQLQELLIDSFKYRDSAIKKEDPHALFLLDTVEPVCAAFENKRYGDMFAVFPRHQRPVRNHADKKAWADHLAALTEARKTQTIGEVIDLIRSGQRFPLPDAVERKERSLAERSQPLNPAEPDGIERLRSMRAVPYKQLLALKEFIDERTPFSTKHGVKGSEFENVLVVFGRGWNDYNFVQFLELADKPIPNDKLEAYERNRNLFYVVCSRPKRRLALLFTQELTAGAFKTLEKWFAGATVQSLPPL